MKVLKIILIVIAILIAIPLVTALFVKKDYAVEREIIINKPKQEVFDYIKYLKNQDNYAVWNNLDPKMKKEYKGDDGIVGFEYFWDSTQKNVGKGSQKITKIIDGDCIEMIISFKEPFESNDNAYMTTEAIDSTQTKVKWGFAGKFPYPMNLMQLFMDMDKEIGKDLDSGLQNLKKVLEK